MWFRLSRGGAIFVLIGLLTLAVGAPAWSDDPDQEDQPNALDEAVESLLIDPKFSAELFKDQRAPQKTLPDDEEAVAGDGGSMPAVAEDAEETEEAPDKASVESTAPAVDALKKKVRTALGVYYRRHLNTRDHTPWEMFHQIIAFGPETLVHKGGPQGEKVDAVRWLCDNKPSRGMQLMHLERGKMALRRAKGVQGHYGQFLAILAQRDIPRDFPIVVEGRKFTVEDLIRTEQRTCRAGEELTFKLMAFMHYLEPGAKWKNDRGETWTIERVLRDEIGSPIRGAACGGTHRLMGISYAVSRRKELDQPIDGEYLRADKYLRDYHRYAFSLQNEDGSFSTEWFAGRGNRELKDRKLQTTGHITEWLAYSVPEEHLDDPRMAKAIDFLATLLLEDRRAEWKIGPLGHALHALALYDERVFVTAENEALPMADVAKAAVGEGDKALSDAELDAIETAKKSAEIDEPDDQDAAASTESATRK
ncbi:MAG: hypothetical protein SGJ19_16530 [Planctomycetia bacterium]|nr:hypothetical protein [Planctomycetia bacterium]